MTIELPDIEEHDVALIPRRRTVRSGTSTHPDLTRPLEQRLAIGGPWSRLLDPRALEGDELEPDARRFLEYEGTVADFFLVQVTCSFRPENDEPFAKAVLRITLSASHPEAAAPIAWSMKPDRLTTPTTLSRTVKLDGSLKVFGVGLGAGLEQSREQPDEIFVEAFFEGLSNPTWEVTRTSNAEISGLQRFILVVRAAKGAGANGRATLGATISKRRFGVIPYEAALGGDAAPLEFVLS